MTRPVIVRCVVLATTAGLLAPALGAHAAPLKKKKPTCNLVTDARGDATGTGLPVSAPNDGNLDIIGADLATNATTMTGVIRVASFSTADTSAPTGREYQVVYTVGTATGSINAVISPSGTSWAGGKGQGAIDTAKHEIHISVPLAALAVPVPAKAKLTAIGAATWRVGTTDQIALGNVDKAQSASSYIAGWPSCVKVGA
jgi:hypothetical protein